MTAYYNENDPAAVAALEALMGEGLIAPGKIDSRSIKEVQPHDVEGFTQVHWFAGFGGWSMAARAGGWRDDRPIWSASCPCQPYAAAGRRQGADDPRHLWPDLYRIVREQRPAVLVGEQVAGKLGYGWFDGVSADLARENIASRTVDIPALAVDGPHERNRLFWIAVADAEGERGGRDIEERRPEGRAADRLPDAGGSFGVDLVDAESIGRGEGRAAATVQRRRDAAPGANLRGCGVTLGDAEREGLEGHARHGDGSGGRPQADRPASPSNGLGVGQADTDQPLLQREPSAGQFAQYHADDGPRPNGTFWTDSEWIICSDGKARRAKPGVRFLVNGLPGRIDLWRLAGNGIVFPLAAQAIRALREAIDAGEIVPAGRPAGVTPSHRKREE